jgi:hypothetical protein
MEQKPKNDADVVAAMAMLDAMVHDAAVEALEDEEVAAKDLEYFGIKEGRALARIEAAFAEAIEELRSRSGDEAE